jgi:hypothetical protein
MKLLTAVTAAGLLVFAGCDFGNVSRNSAEVARARMFEKKKLCAQIGLEFYQRNRTEFERMLGHKRVSPADEDDGPYCAYNSDRDTCLVSWESTSTVERPDRSFSRSTYGYLYDALTGELIAHYEVMKDQTGKVIGTTTGNADTFKKTRKVLMGFDPE